MSFRNPVLAAAITLLAAAAAGAQQPAEPIDSAMNAKIRAEGIDHSKIMWIEHYLTDVYGPRPIGSPESRRRRELGGEDDDELGDEERAPRAVHLARRRLAAGHARAASSHRR